MANYNMTSIKRIVADLGLEGVQLIPSTNPNNCSKILYKGKEYKSSQWTKSEAEAVLTELKEGVKCTINNANECRESGDEIIARYIDMQNKSFNTVLTEYLNMDKVPYSAWVSQLYNFYNTNEDGKEINKDFNAESIARKLLEDRKNIIFKGNVYSQKGIEYLIKAWHNENIEKITSAKAEQLSYKVIDKLCMI